MSDNTVILGIKITSDQAAADAAAASIKQQSTAFDQVRQSIATFQQQSAAQISQINTNFGNLADNLEGVSARGIASIGRLTSILGDPALGRDFVLLADVGRVQAVLTDTINNVKQALSDATAGAAQAAVGIGALTKEEMATATSAQAILEEMGPTAVALGLAAVAVAGVVAAISSYNQMLKEQEAAVQSALDSLKTYYQAIETGTTASIQKQLEGEQQKQKIAEDQTKQIAAVFAGQVRGDAFHPQFQHMTDEQIIEDYISKGGAGLNTGLNELIAAYQKQKTEVDNAQFAINAYNNALNSNVVKVNDQAAELKKYYDLIENGNAQQIKTEENKQRVALASLEAQKQAIDNEQKAAAQRPDAAKDPAYQRRTELSKQLGTQIFALQNEITNVYEAALNSSQVQLRSAVQNFVKEITPIPTEVQKFFAGLSGTAQKAAAADAKADSLEFSNILKGVTSVLDEAAKVAKAYEASVKKINDAYQQGVTKLNEQAERDATAHASNLTRIQHDEQQREADIIRQYNEQRQQTLAKRALDEARTLAQQQLDLKNLAAAGDVAAFVQKQEQDKLANDSRQAQYRLDDQVQAQHLDDQLNAEKENAQKQIDAENTAYAQRQQALDDQLEALKQHEQDQMDVLNQSHTDQLTALQSHESNILNINSDIYQSIESMATQAQNFWSMVQNAANQTTTGSSPTVGGGNYLAGGGMGGFGAGQGLILHVHNANSDIITRAHLENAKGEMLQLVAQSFDMAHTFEGST